MKLEKKRTKAKMEFEDSSGNVFADLGFDNPDSLLAKSTLIIRLRKAMEVRGLTEAVAANRFNVNRSDLAAALRGELDRLSSDELNALLQSVSEGNGEV